MNIKELPDYPLLKKLASALWKTENHFHGAAVMVGAGFTRCAAQISASNKKPPLWDELANKLNQQLKGEGSKESQHDDPLKLAEEFSAYLGKQALRDLLKKEIHDAAWSPSDLHKNLLTLPWTEVLTTNWDTLLERASEQDADIRLYSIVRQQEDLSNAISPRIVKLHGTINISEDLVFTSEDYRFYPQKHAAFVNFARQVFIENELCLIGFSGEDPNFLQWAGWVRDQLASHARRIYLVGALGLSPSRRKYLESINVAPIDLEPLACHLGDKDLKHRKALEIVLEELQILKPKKPWEWKPSSLVNDSYTSEEMSRRHKDASYSAKILEEQLPTLEADRLAYPGWLVCPVSARSQLNQQISDPWPTPQNLAAMSKGNREKLLYEIAWRDSVTFDVINPALIQDMLTVCDPATPNTLTKQQQLEIALTLLQGTRWLEPEQVTGVAEKTNAILETHQAQWTDCINSLRYHQAVVARDALNYPKLEAHANQIEPRSPIWKMRKAALLAEVGEHDRGRELIEQAYKELQTQSRHERHSIRVLSQLAWAHWLRNGIRRIDWFHEKFPSRYADALCGPIEAIDAIEDHVNEKLEKQNKPSIEPSFTPGTYKDHSKTVTLGGSNHPVLLLDGVSSTVGIPIHWGERWGINFLSEITGKIAELEGLDGDQFILAIRAANSESSPVIQRLFSVIGTACIPHETVEQLIEKNIDAIGYWRSRMANPSMLQLAMRRLQVHMEVLARLSTRASVEKCKEVFRLALSLGNDVHFKHHWLYAALEHLLNYSLRSIPESRHCEVLLDALQFPLEKEMEISGPPQWPNPLIQNPGPRPSDAAFDRRIDEIIDKVKPCTSASAPPLQRLLPLLEHGIMNEAEKKKLANAVWGQQPTFEAAPQTGLLWWCHLLLPSTNPQAVKKIIESVHYEKFGRVSTAALLTDEGFSLRQDDIDLLMSIAYAAKNESVELLPSNSQAVRMFELLVNWRPSADANPFVANRNDVLKEHVAKVIGYSVCRSLPTHAHTPENFERLMQFISDVKEPAALLALPSFANGNENFSEAVVEILAKSLQSTKNNYTAYSAQAILDWRKNEDSDATRSLIRRLIYVISSGRTRGTANCVDAATKLVKNKWVTSEEINNLQESLQFIFESTEYSNVDEKNQWGVLDAPVTRLASIKLARAILQTSDAPNDRLNELIHIALNDPIPEVRFAAGANQ